MYTGAATGFYLGGGGQRGWGEGKGRCLGGKKKTLSGWGKRGEVGWVKESRLIENIQARWV